jgi:phytoene desaturase
MKIVVIGGGLSGLAAAALLAKQGHQVTLLEKNDSLGGRSGLLEDSGFTFDMGPSWYMMPEVFDKYFSYFGYSTKDFYQLEKLDPKYRVFSDTHKVHDVAADLKKAIEFFETTEPSSSKKLASLLKKTSSAYSISTKLLYKQIHSLKDMFDPELLLKGLQLLLQFNPFQSYHSLVEKFVKTPYLQHLLEFHTVFMGGSPHNTPALYSILIAADFLQQVHYPLGGLTKVPQALEQLCVEQGVSIKTNHAVTGLDLKSGYISSVKTATSTFEADVVVNTADYAFFDSQIVPKGYQEYSESYWNSRTYSISSLLLYLGIDKKLNTLKHHNFYFQEDWNGHFNDIFKDNKLPEDPCFYLCAPSKTDAGVAPANKENLFVLVPVGTDSPDAGSDEYINKILKHIESKIGESFIDDISVKHVFSQKDFAANYNAYKGNALGLAHTLEQSILLRPKMSSSKIKNLYHAGQFTQPGVGVPMTLISAELVTKLVMKHDSVKK